MLGKERVVLPELNFTRPQEIFAAIYRGEYPKTEYNSINTFTEAYPKLLSHPEIVDNLLRDKPVVPVSMEVDLSYFCGDKCNFCHFAYTHQNPINLHRGGLNEEAQAKVFLSPNLAIRIFEDMTKSGVRSVVFSGGGEPLDNPNALRVFQIARECGLKMGMYTRGFGLRGELADFVSDNFDWIVVSLDVTNSQDHQEVKGTGERVFKIKVENICKFVAKKNRRASISVSLMVAQHHLNTVESYEDQKILLGATSATKLERDILWLLGLGVDEVQTRPIVDTGSYEEQREQRRMRGMAFKTDQDEWQRHYSWITPTIRLLGKYKDVPGLNISLDKFTDLLDGTSGFDKCDGMVVSAGLIGTDGKVYKCVNLRQITPIGDLKVESLRDIYLNPNLDREVNGKCRAGCRGCKVNVAMRNLRNGELLPEPLSKVKHPDFI